MTVKQNKGGYERLEVEYGLQWLKLLRHIISPPVRPQVQGANMVCSRHARAPLWVACRVARAVVFRRRLPLLQLRRQALPPGIAPRPLHGAGLHWVPLGARPRCCWSPGTLVAPLASPSLAQTRWWLELEDDEQCAQDYTGVVAALYSRAALLRARRFRHDRGLRAASGPGDALRSCDVRLCPTAIRTARRHTNNLDPILLQMC
ncbi:hypothetical protein GUJ93_ZPchr0010g8198 [Zizania palustris]|uniref:Uncharacterized protein n=1 Tax=Zizania palustris TaxID=103762 RepID=A0A8J5WGA7_ZIZPA|nr:hypothetical protein GUJ93_ZPchr0010g8198 [Zizania palustris]